MKEPQHVMVIGGVFEGLYWIRTFNDLHGIPKSIKIMLHWITTFKDYKSHGVFD